MTEKKVSEFETAYIPDDPKNKVYAVDAYMTVAKCFRVEAASEEEAKEIVRQRIIDALHGKVDGEDTHTLASMGFADAEEMEVKVSGETDERGCIQYY